MSITEVIIKTVLSVLQAFLITCLSTFNKKEGKLATCIIIYEFIVSIAIWL